MSHVVDARGLLCPQPVMILVRKMRDLGQGEIEVLVDSETARENICRTVAGSSWRVKESVEVDDCHKMIISSDR
jgi:TusA-related sulfurtransferase